MRSRRRCCASSPNCAARPNLPASSVLATAACSPGCATRSARADPARDTAGLSPDHRAGQGPAPQRDVPPPGHGNEVCVTPPVFLSEPGGLDGATAVLSGPEGRHAASVRRMAVGETLHLVDGAGTRARCRVAEIGKDRLVCAVEERAVEPRSHPQLTVVQALPKGDRGELAVEVMTEAGVDRIVPWAAERCITRWKPERAAKSLAKWRATAREGAKQSRRSRIPEVTEPAGIGDVCA